MCQEKFFYVLATAIAACQCLKFLLTGAVEASDLAQAALRGDLDTQPSNCEADTLPLSYRRPSTIFVANA